MKINELKERLMEISIEMQKLPDSQAGEDRYRQLEIEYDEIRDRLDCQEASL